jgi:tetratricopeptide (TPR) repeat protein
MFKLLTGPGSRTALPRQQTLRALIDWSYDLISEPERRLLRRLSVFQGGWTLEAAEAVCSGDGIEAREVLDLLSQLVQKSLVIYEDAALAPWRGGSEEWRYRLLETIRQYGWERLCEGENGTVPRQHREYFRRLAEEAEEGLDGPEQKAWLERLEREHDNLRAALDRCPEGPEGAEAEARIVAALQRFWAFRGYRRELRERLGKALARVESGVSAPTRARLLFAAAMTAIDDREYGKASAFLEETLSLWQELNDAIGVTRSLAARAGMALFQGDSAAARSLCEEALAIARAAGHRRRTGQLLVALGNAVYQQGETHTARRLYEEGLEILRELGDPNSTLQALQALGGAARAAEEFERANALFQEALEIARHVGLNWAITFSLINLGRVAADQGETASAHALLSDALARARSNEQKQMSAYALIDLCRVAYEQGDDARSREYVEEALVVLRPAGERWSIADALHLRGLLLARQGDLDAARAALEESLSLGREVKEPRWIARALHGLGRLAAAEGKWERAARLWGAAEARRAAASLPTPSRDRAERARELAAARATLGDAPFAAAWATGQTLTLEEALAEAGLDPERTG